VHAVKESKGMILSINDREIIKARQYLSRHEGIDTEPSGAATFAALQHARIPKNKRVVLVLTGHGLKDLEHC
jgi:threonine synthase